MQSVHVTSSAGSPPRTRGFTLVEILVCLSIIALLMAMLLPALASARDSALAAQSSNNLRQVGMAMSAYSIQHDGFLPMHSSPSSTSPRTRWPDHLWPYLPVAEIYRSPMLLESDWEENFAKPFAHTVGTTEPKYHGGYGYNFQYLGNSRFTPTYHARVGAHVTDASRTIAVADTAGSRKGDANRRPGQGGEAVYVVDPPLGSARGAGNGGAYYAGGMDEPDGTPETYLWRSFPAERNNGKVAVLFVDGHARFSTLRELDDLNNDGVKDNGYWNGHGDARLR